MISTIIDSWMPNWTQDFEIDSVRVWKYQEENPTEIHRMSTSARVTSTFMTIVSYPGMVGVSLNWPSANG